MIRHYRCLHCEVDWDYEVVRYVARCPACGGALTPHEAGPRRALSLTVDHDFRPPDRSAPGGGQRL